MNENKNELKEVVLKTKKILSNNKILICIIFLIFVISSYFYAVTTPPIYSASSKFVTTVKATNTSAVSSNIIALAGINMNNSGFLDPSLYLKEKLKDELFCEKILYSKITNDSIVLLNNIIYQKRNITIANKIERKIILDIFRSGKYAKLDNDLRTGMLTLETFFFDPQIAYELNKIFIYQFDQYIRNSIKMQTIEKKTFIENRLTEVEKDLSNSEKDLVQFQEKNIGGISPTLQLEMQRLHRKVTINQELYLQLRKQYEVVIIESKKDQPMIEIIINPELPIYKIWPNKTKIIVFGIFGGLFIGILIVLTIEWLVTSLDLPRKNKNTK